MTHNLSMALLREGPELVEGLGRRWSQDLNNSQLRLRLDSILRGRSAYSIHCELTPHLQLEDGTLIAFNAEVNRSTESNFTDYQLIVQWKMLSSSEPLLTWSWLYEDDGTLETMRVFFEEPRGFQEVWAIYPQEDFLDDPLFAEVPVQYQHEPEIIKQAIGWGQWLAQEILNRQKLNLRNDRDGFER